MTDRPIVDSYPVLAVGKALALWLAAIAVYCVAVALFMQWRDIRPVEWSGAASLINTIILGLLMGFRNRAAYDRWWEARRLWGQLTNDTRNLAWKLAAFLPTEVLARSRVAELLADFPVALKHHLRGDAPRLRDLPGFEHESDVPDHLPSYLAGRLYAVVAGWNRDGYLGDEVLRILDPHLSALLDICGACERIKNTPLSPSYKALLRTGLALYILEEPWYISPEISFWGAPVFLLACFFLLGVELIDSIVEEPFGRERDDLDLERYCQTIRDSVRMSLPLGPKAG
jgi:putative membrane protein